MNSTLLLIAQAGFALLTIVYLTIFLRELKKGIDNTTWDASRKKRYFLQIVLYLILWMVFVSVWSLSGIMTDFTMFPLNIAAVVGPALITPVVLLFSKSWAEVLKNIPTPRFIALQHFRIFVEMLLWTLFIANVLPVQMTFEGRNFDILAGLTAPIVGWLALRSKISRAGLVIWNIACIGLLFNIIIIAILSAPTPIRVFMNEPANTIVAFFPVSWLPGFLAPFAFALHVFSLKQLLIKR